MTNQEINEVVARKLGYPIGRHEPPIPNYCTDIKPAWEVVKHLPNLNCIVLLSDPLFVPERWCCTIGRLPGYFAKADTAPMAICLAFLKLPT